MTFTKLLNEISNFFRTNKTEILTGAGIASMAAATVVAVKCNENYEKDIREKEESGKELSKKEKIFTGIKHYSTPVVLSVVGAGLIISSDVHSSKEKAAILTKSAILETNAMKLGKVIKEKLGDEEYEKIKKNIAVEKSKNLKENKAVQEEHRLEQYSKYRVFIDTYTGKEFLSTEDELNKIMYKYAAKTNYGGWCTYSDIFSEIEKPVNYGDFGEKFGWNSAHKLSFSIEPSSEKDAYGNYKRLLIIHDDPIYQPWKDQWSF